jgi:hypothetical protein
MKYNDYQSIDTARALTARLYHTVFNNLKSFLCLIPAMALATWIGWDLLHSPEIPQWLEITWWIMLGWQLGWILGIIAIYRIAKFYTNVSEKESPMEWAEENGARVYPEDEPIADTGDYSTTWVCFTEESTGYGHTFIESIQDAMKEKTDPTKWDYVPNFEES